MRRWLLLAGLFAACGKKIDHGGGAPKKAGLGFPVEVVVLVPRTVEYKLTAVGSVDAYEELQVTARVVGVVERVRFDEGDTVKEGQSLAEIEPERYRLSVQAARAAYEKAEAARADAEAGLARREAVNKESAGLVTAEELETFRTRARAAASDVLAAKTALELAELNEAGAKARAPAAGIIQRRAVQTGQYVQVGTVIATLVRRDPMLLRFQVPGHEAAQLVRGATVSFSVRGADSRLEATVTHVAEMADRQTRMVSVVAEIKAPPRSLRAGAFAEVTIATGQVKEALVVPQAAIRPSERGFLAFVIEGDTAKERVLELGMRTDDSLVEIRRGLTAGETLVVRGAEALREGAAVRIAPGPGSAPGSVPSGGPGLRGRPSR